MINQNPFQITFYVENQTKRPKTVNQNAIQNFNSIKRRFTPLIRNRNIRQKFLLQFKSQEMPQTISTDRKAIIQVNRQMELHSKREFSSCNKKSRGQSLSYDEQKKHELMFEMQKKNYMKVMKRYCNQVSKNTQNMGDYLDFYA